MLMYYFFIPVVGGFYLARRDSILHAGHKAKRREQAKEEAAVTDSSICVKKYWRACELMVVNRK